MNRWMVEHDPQTGKVLLYRVELAAVVEQTGQVDEFGRHQVHAQQVADRDFTDSSFGAALEEILDLDPSAEDHR